RNREGGGREHGGREGGGKEGAGERGAMHAAGEHERGDREQPGQRPGGGEAPHEGREGRDASAEDGPPKRRPGRQGRISKRADGKPVATPVRLGLSDSQRTEVLEGLAESDVVITGEVGGPGQAPASSLTGTPRPGGGGVRRAF